MSVGHCHPEVVRAVDEQSRRLQHTTTIYLNDQIAMYAKELTDRLPGDLKVRPDAAWWVAVLRRNVYDLHSLTSHDC